MKQTVILDTGPLVAFLHRREAHHVWATEQWRRFQAPLITCEAVLTEAAFLHHRFGGQSSDVIDLVAAGAVQVPFRVSSETQAVSGLLSRYTDVPMSLADACLVRMAELHIGGAVFTIDSNFRTYRIHGRKVIPAIMPEK